MNQRSIASPSWPDGSPAAGVAPQVSRGWNLRSLYFCSIAFLLGVLYPWTVSLVGNMPIGELVVLFLLGQTLLAVVLTSRLPKIPSPWLLGFFGVAQIVAILSYVVSDLYRASLPVDMVRGWMRMFFLLADIIGLAILFGEEPRVLAWRQLGYGLSFVQVFFIPPLFGDYWKFGYGIPLTTLVVLVVPYIGGRIGSLAALACLGTLHTALGFRSMGAACFLNGGLIALRYLPLRVRQGLLLAGFAAFLIAIPRLVSDTFTSESGRSNRSNVERGAMLQAAWEGFVSSPLIGQGSWFSRSNVTDNFVLIRRQAAKETRNMVGFSDNDVEEVAIHSQILMALAEGGIFGAAFFVCYGLGIIWAIWYTLGEAPWSWLIPAQLFLLVAGMWDLLMSPFAGPVRLNISLITVLIAVLWSERRFRATPRASPAAHFLEDE
jgi:hypothetical protein